LLRSRFLRCVPAAGCLSGASAVRATVRGHFSGMYLALQARFVR
jgi:hypothetical protein